MPDANNLVTEDDTLVDNFASAKQQRFLVGSLYSSAQQPTFLAEANIGIFHKANQPEQRTQLLAEQLRALGVEPDPLT